MMFVRISTNLLTKWDTLQMLLPVQQQQQQQLEVKFFLQQ